MYELTIDIADLDEEKVYQYLFSIGAGSITSHRKSSLIQVLCNAHADISKKFESRIVQIKAVEDSDWKHKWNDSFAGFAINDDIYVWPVNSYIPEDNKYTYNIKLHMDNVFGDGHHPTTRMCGIFLYDYLTNISSPKKQNFTFIDIGSGTGVLSIIAYMLGVRKIELCDIEKDAVINAYKNIITNDVNEVVPFQADIYEYTMTKKYNIITANLLTGIIIDNIAKFNSALKKNGIMIISGISDTWVKDAIKAFKKQDLEIVKHVTVEEWNAFLLIKNSNACNGASTT